MAFLNVNESSMSSGWDTPMSDINEYISYSLNNEINTKLSDLYNKSYNKSIEFSPGKRVKYTRVYSHNMRMMHIKNVFKKFNNIKICKELIIYFNKYGFLNSNSQYKFIEYVYRYNKTRLIKYIEIDNVNNIKKLKYDSNKTLLNIAILVRNRNLKKIKYDSKIKSILNKIDINYVNKYLSLYIEDGEVVEDAYEVVEDNLVIDVTTFRKRPNKRYLENERLLTDTPYKEIVVPVRNPTLLAKLKNIILRFKMNRMKRDYREEIPLADLNYLAELPTTSRVQPEMMEPDKPVQQSEAGPVVLNALEQDSTVVSAPLVNDDFWIKNSTSDILVDQKHASAMEILLTRFTWKSSHNAGFILFEKDLPSEAIVDNPTHPAAMMFNQYAYWHGDIKIRMHVNTTPFHVGKLILSWYYGQHFDNNAQDRNNIASAVQLPHETFVASKGGDIVMVIPYRNYRSMLCTRKKHDDSLYFYLGTLTCRVFNPLTIETATEVEGYVHISFINNKFTGICPRLEVQPEMMGIGKYVKTAEKVLNVIDGALNRDKPNNPSVPAMYTPQFTDSFSTGTGDVSNVHALRLNPTGVTQHPIGSINNDDTSVLGVARKWGFLKTILWNKSYNTGYSLYSLPVTADLDFDSYYHVDILGDLDNYISSAIIPPVCAMANINVYNRGSLEIKIEFVNSRYHTGALLASFVPVQNSVTFETAVQAYNATMDIGNTDEYIFKIPYINERPYNPRYYRYGDTGSDKLSAIGAFNLFVITELRNNASTSAFTYVNIYIRAGEDFEFVVPAAPFYTINLDKKPPPNDGSIYPTGNPGSCGLATWRYASVIENNIMVMKWGVEDDAIFQFGRMEPFVVYKASWTGGLSLETPFQCGYIEYDATKNAFTDSAVPIPILPVYIAKLIVNGDGNKYSYAITFMNLVSAVSYIRAHYAKRTVDYPYPDSPTLNEWRATDTNNRIFYLWRPNSAQDSYRFFKGAASGANMRYIIEQRAGGLTTEMNVDPTVSSLSSTMYGMRMFGESFNDLKDYLRRYQGYGSYVMTTSKGAMGCLLKVPVSYLGTNSSNVANSPTRYISREGLIPYILSAYRFARGSIRFKIVIYSANDSAAKKTDEVFYIQHRPDVIPKDRDLHMVQLGKNSTVDSLFLSGYAYTAISTSVNNNITIDVPCYIPTNMLMLQAPAFNRHAEILHYFLGTLYIYLQNSDPTSKQYVNIHYSLSDDFQMSDFVGFPPMNTISKRDVTDIEPQMDVNPSTSSAVTTNVVPESLISSVKTRFTNFVGSSVRESLGLDSASNDDSLAVIIKDACLKFGSDNKHIIASFVSQLVHCIMHPDINTFAIACITILSHLGLNSFSYIKRFCKWFMTLFSDNVEPQMDMEENKAEKSSKASCIVAFYRSIVDMCISVFNGTKNCLSGLSMPDFSSSLFTNIRFGAITVNGIIQLVKNLFDVVPKIFSWIGRNLNPMAWYRWFISDNRDFIGKWVRDVEWVTDPNNLTKVRSETRYCYHVELLIMVGRDINVKLNNIKDKNMNITYFNLLSKKLDSLYQDIAINNLTAGSIGVEPFCFCVFGESQVGKTYITKAVSAAMLKGVGYVTNEQLFYTRPISSKHWDGVERQPICIYDDFGQVTIPELAAEKIGEFILLKSKATFTPPRAAVEDKGKKYNPLIVAMTMNDPYCKFEGIARNEAWQYRRDVLIHAELKSEYAGQNANTIDEDVLRNFDHLLFSIQRYNGISNSEDQRHTLQVEVPTVSTIDFEEPTKVCVKQLVFAQLVWYLTERFKITYAKMRSEFIKDLELQQSFLPSKDLGFNANLENYRTFILENKKYLNIRELNTLKHVKDYVNKIKCDKCKNIMCVCDSTVFQIENIGTLSEVNNVIPEMENMLVTIAKTIKPVLTHAEISKLCSIPLHYKAVKEFKEKPCIHLLLLLLDSQTELVIDIEGIVPNHTPKILCITTGKTWLTNNTECTCKDELTIFQMNSLYGKLVLDPVHAVHFVDASALPTKLIVPSKEYLMRQSTWKERFMTWLNENVCVSTWLGKTGQLIQKVMKPLAYVIGVVSLLYGIKNYKHIVSRVSNVTSFVKSKVQCNKMFAKMVESHIVTEDCVTKGCNICASPEMAYNDKVVTRPRRNVIIDPKVRAEMAYEMQTVLDRKLRRNYFFISALDSVSGRPILCRCLGLEDHWFIAIDHYFDKIKSMPLDTILEYRTSQVVIRLHLEDLVLHKLKNSALILGKMPLNIPCFSNITKYFIQSKHISAVARSAKLYACDMPSQVKPINEYVVTWHDNNITLHDDTLYVPHILDESLPSTNVSNYFKYQTSGSGLCGSVLITDMNVPSPIIGIHIAGLKSGGCGYSEVVCQETIINIIRNNTGITHINDVEIEGQMFQGKLIPFIMKPSAVVTSLEGSYEFAGVVDRKFSYRASVKSKCAHSIAYNKITNSTYDYPHISHKDVRFEGSPMYNGCMHHTNPVIPFKSKDLYLIEKYLYEKILAKVPPLRANVGVLSVNDAIMGINTLEGYDAMAMDTSEGFPFSSVRPSYAKDKKWLFNIQEQNNEFVLLDINKDLLAVMDDKHKLRSEGIVPATVFTDCLKDLKLPKEKCHKTRIFSISPVDFTIQFRQYFMDFTIAFQQARFDVDSAIGINVDSYEWHNMVQMLLENSPAFVCGDYSKFGPRLMSCIVMKFFKAICDWYYDNGDTSLVHYRIRFIMGMEIAFSLHLMFNMLYRVYSGAPSGSPITTILNNYVNMFYIGYCFNSVIIANKSLNIDYVYMDNYIRCIYYGDDLIMTVKQDILEYFNAKVISDILEGFDIRFTDALKTGYIKKYLCCFDKEVSFLKRNIKRHAFRNVFCAAMDKRAIEETCNWVFLNHVEPEASIIASEAMLLNAHGHGEEYYDTLRSKVLYFWRAFKILPQIPSWREVDDRIYGV